MLKNFDFVGGGASGDAKKLSFRRFFCFQYKEIYGIPRFKSKSAFSVAEAMVTLLLVSVALAASAPLLTRQMKSSASGSIQLNQLINRIEQLEREQGFSEGMIMYFDGNTCPEGWSPLSNKYPEASNSFLRNMGGAGRTIGSKQLDAAPNITGAFTINHEVSNFGGYRGVFSKGAKNGESWDGQDWSENYEVVFDASTSSESYGRDNATEVRPQNITFLACRKNKVE